MSKYQIKGILISILFIVACVAFALRGIDLGRFLWIALVICALFAALYYCLWTTIRLFRGKRGAK